MANSNITITDTGTGFKFEWLSDAIFGVDTVLNVQVNVGQTPPPPVGASAFGFVVGAGAGGKTACEVTDPYNAPHTDIPFFYEVITQYLNPAFQDDRTPGQFTGTPGGGAAITDSHNRRRR